MLCSAELSQGEAEFCEHAVAIVFVYRSRVLETRARASALRRRVQLKSVSGLNLKLLVVLSVGVLIASSGLMLQAVSTQNAATPGCHGHSPSTPSPKPVSYQCCAAGHTSALPPEILNVVVFAPVAVQINSPISIEGSERSLFVIHQAAASPPTLSALRI